MYIKFLVSLVLPIIYIFLKNHIELKTLEKKNYEIKLTKRDFINYDLGFIVLIILNLFSIDSLILMNLWVFYYMILTIIYIRTSDINKKVKDRQRYFDRVWRLDILYLLIISYIIFTYQQINMIVYYGLLGMFIYLQKIITLLINHIVLQIEVYKEGSEIK